MVQILKITPPPPPPPPSPPQVLTPSKKIPPAKFLIPLTSGRGGIYSHPPTFTAIWKTLPIQWTKFRKSSLMLSQSTSEKGAPEKYRMKFSNLSFHMYLLGCC